MQASSAVPIFERSIQLRRESGQLYATLIIAGHFLHLVESADLSRASVKDSVEAGQFIARQRRNIEALKAEIRKDDAGQDILKNYAKDLRFLQVCDYLSLLLCTDFNGEETIENVPYLRDISQIKVTRKSSNLALTLDPLPFKKNLRDHLTSWIIPYIPYETSEELASAMEEVKTTTTEVHFGAA